ncbi:DUF2975 domain-containing protein [Altererythrobacter sp. H2]|uniref:DUF2975 domain-containing protein n=1 Tax=Altererythrobacter sp. H2 TaxID=3108391 RepID=UPI002B4BCE26|nr:DUF2975 domain-containing protein [Altererythrobacter sp. H2]WRK96408.1 DUF2975 domain-containing protein [Altererythrobacter sp. H2]
MTQTGRDPLLLAAQGLLWFFIGALCFALIMVGIGLPAAAIFQDRIIAEAAAKGITAGPELVGAVLLVMVAVFVFLGLAVYFLMLLLRIVGSVKEGDPFIAINAERLSRMGWIALASQLATIPLAAVVLWIDELVGDVEDVHIDTDLGVSGEGLLLVLILFILARVFRKGAEMRDELEGTV